MKRLAIVMGMATAFTLMANDAMAQRAPMSETFYGEGTVNLNGRRSKLTRVDVTLNRNGDATLTFNGDRRIDISGDWKTAGREDYEIDVRRALGDSRASGLLKVDLSGNEVRRFDIRNGRYNGGSFSLDFTPRRDNNGGGWVGNGDLNISDRATGDGRYSRPGDQKDFNAAWFTIKKDGKFDIAISGGKVTGTYRRTSASRLILSINGFPGVRNGNGSGTLELVPGRNQVRSFTVNGRGSNGNFNGNWNRGGFGGSGGWDNDRPGGGWGNGDDNWNQREFKFEEWGRGDLTVANKSWRVDRMEGNFRRDGKFTMEVWSDRQRIRIEGKWENRHNDNIVLEVERADGARARGTGTITLDRNGIVTRANFLGNVDTNANQRTLRFSFTREARRPQPR